MLINYQELRYFHKREKKVAGQLSLWPSTWTNVGSILICQPCIIGKTEALLVRQVGYAQRKEKY